jgi:hypothetical protein
MPDNVGSGGTSPPNNNNNNNNNSENQQSRRQRGHRGQSNRDTRFQGNNEELKGIVYDISSHEMDSFRQTTIDIAEYIGRKFDNAGEFRLGMPELELPPLVEPALPTDTTNIVDMELWKLAIREHVKKNERRQTNSDRAYALVLGQCSQALRNRLEADTEWDHVNTSSNLIGLLKLIQQCMIQRQTRKYNVHTVFDAEYAFYTLQQGRHMSNHDYYTKFKDVVKTL